MASRSLLDLREDVRAKAVDFQHKCIEAGIEILIICTYRSIQEQAVEYAKGRTTPGPKTTNAKPGESKHNHTDFQGHPQSLAFDCVPLVNGKCVWDAKSPLWEKVGEIGESCGLSWAGHWKTFKEFPHFQVEA